MYDLEKMLKLIKDYKANQKIKIFVSYTEENNGKIYKLNKKDFKINNILYYLNFYKQDFEYNNFELIIHFDKKQINNYIKCLNTKRLIESLEENNYEIACY